MDARRATDPSTTLQRSFPDRRFTAAFYTRPESAALLAELAVRMLVEGRKHERSGRPTVVADYACGAGALLDAARAALKRQRAENRSATPTRTAKEAETILIGGDIAPEAVTAAHAVLRGRTEGEGRAEARIKRLPYGVPTEGGTPRLGALDLIGAENAGGRADLVIMNPPYTRPTNHEKSTTAVPSFAGRKTNSREQRAMSARLKELRSRKRETAGDGHAGLASDFIDVADAVIRPGGVLALVLPLAVLAGASWGEGAAAPSGAVHRYHNHSAARKREERQRTGVVHRHRNGRSPPNRPAAGRVGPSGGRDREHQGRNTRTAGSHNP